MQAGGKDMLAHLAKLKPVKGWREFLGEVGIIVLGVMIALTADKIAQHYSDNNTADDARADISDELNDGLAAMALRRATEPCIERRLQEIRALLNDWRRTGRFETPQWVAQTPIIEISLARYNAAQSAGRLALLSGEEQYRMGAVIEGLGRFDRLQRDERLVWAQLRALQMGAEALSDEDRSKILTALQEASTLDYEAKIAARQTLPLAGRFGYRPDYERIREVAGQTWTNGRYTPSICSPITMPRAEANKTQVTPLPE